uniref:Uncharacterized protein n=1 Tax=viral metagenome TaxID=1070528 RepID=A0A6M3KQM5_9ZZZZ
MSQSAETLVGRIVRYRPLALSHMANAERAASDHGLCTRIEGGEDNPAIAWVVWDHTYAPVWEIAGEIEPAEGVK